MALLRAGGVGKVVRILTDDGIARLRLHYFCPETLAEVASRWQLPVHPTGYHL